MVKISSMVASKANHSPDRHVISNSERKDRSIRLWGERGQLALERGHVCVLNATVVATEVLKNLVLPGVGAFTIVDSHRVSERDLGNNFFVTQESIGEPRCHEVMKNLLELNEEVKGNAVDEDACEIIMSNLDFFDDFSCVIVSDLPEKHLLLLANRLWERGIPLFLGKAYGMIGLWRNVIPEVCIVESRPEYAKENYRLANPFPELAAFVERFDLETCRHPYIPLTETQSATNVFVDHRGRPIVPKAHSHIPAFVLLIKALQKWRAQHEGKMPQTGQEKDQFRELLDDFQLSVGKDEENFVEAKALARHAYSPFEIPSEVKAILSDPKAGADSNCQDPFWIIVRALREFVEGEGGGCLPLSGMLPDMHADTKSYIDLQNIYREQATRDCSQVSARVQHILSSMNQRTDAISPAEISLICKNAANIRLVRTRSLQEEYSSPCCDDWSWMLDMPEEFPHYLYVLLRAADRYKTNFGSFPGEMQPLDEAEVARFKEVLGALCSEMGIANGSLTNDMATELVRYGGSELHSIASVVGGIGANEVCKVLMKQFVPANGSFLYNGVTGKNALCVF
uniref:NEDD8-activating enzyme E1 regulatory subunit n=1 Tax=Hanusia phi TaxID=3032 RepID=A0A7S0EYA2_9CRYP